MRFEREGLENLRKNEEIRRRVRELGRANKYDHMGIYIAVVGCSKGGKVLTSDDELRRFCSENALTITEIAQEIMGEEWPVEK
jgi:hypothetical protein